MDKDTTDWTELLEFRSIDLLASFALSWHYEAGSLFLDLDLCLLPAHPFYERPRAAKGHCIRPAMLEFPRCESVTDGDARASGTDIAGLASAARHGAITGLRRVGEGRYVVSGAFGEMIVRSERPILRLGDRLA